MACIGTEASWLGAFSSYKDSGLDASILLNIATYRSTATACTTAQRLIQETMLKRRIVARRTWMRRVGVSVAALMLGYILILAFPQPLFVYTFTYERFRVWSDRPINRAMAIVLDDAKKRMVRSDLYTPSDAYRIFICNSSWKLLIYSQILNDKLGGVTDTWLTRNIYIRASDIPHNQVISPDQTPIKDATDRPLSYFIAHEATHVMQSRSFGRLMAFQYPAWLVEGYADYIGKGGTFDFAQNRKMLAMNDPEMDYSRSGRYRTFHLEVALLLDKRRLSVRQVFANPPKQADMLAVLKSHAPI